MINLGTFTAVAVPVSDEAPGAGDTVGGATSEGGFDGAAGNEGV